MNTIRSYLDNMFRNLPNTEAVRKAKSELLEMMEDKYEELISEGKTENEAVGIVISEFGNLDELAESLGISEAVTENPDEAKPMLSMDRVKEYLAMNSQCSILLPLGIALCIFSVAFNILADLFAINLEVLGVSAMFLAIGAAVGLFIYSGIKRKEFIEVKRKECSLSIESAEYVRAERKSFKSSYGLMSSFGIGLCILSIVNPIVIGSIPYIDSDIGAVMLFLFIALGVFLIVSANSRMNGYDRLLELNEAGRMSEEFVPKSDRKVNKAPIIICAVVAVVIAVVIGGISVMDSLFKGIKYIASEDITDPVSTTYEITSGDKIMGDIDSIKLDLKACSVNFEVKDGSGLIDVQYSGDKKLKPEVSFDNGKLVVTQPNSIKNYRVSALNAPRLTITLGKDVDLSSLEMKINAGDIHMEDVKADYFYGEFDAGNIQINDCTITKIEIDADAGNIEISECNSKTMNIETDAGNINISDSTFEDLNVKANFGNVEIDDIDDLDSYSIDCDIDAGIVQIDGDPAGRNYKRNGSGTGSIKVKVDAGNIELN